MSRISDLITRLENWAHKEGKELEEAFDILEGKHPTLCVAPTSAPVVEPVVEPAPAPTSAPVVEPAPAPTVVEPAPAPTAASTSTAE